MRKILMIIVVLLFTAAAGFSEDSSIQVGYAVITPVSGATSAFVAFETFGLRVGGIGGATQAGVLPPSLTTSAVLFVERSGLLLRNSGFAIVNPNNSAVTLSMTVYDEDGSQLATTNLTVPAHNQVAKFVPELFLLGSLPLEFTGTIVITSTGTSPLPVSVTGLRFRGANFSALPATPISTSPSPVPVISQGVGGPGAILLPQFVAGSGWVTELVVGNNSTSGSVTVRMDFFRSDGTPMAATLNGQTASTWTNVVIPARGVIKFAPRNGSGEDDF